MADSYAFDTWVVLALLQGDARARSVQKILRRAQGGYCRIVMSVVNLGEMYYTVAISRGRTEAARALATVEAMPIEVLPVRRPTAILAAEVKADHSMGYADSFVVAVAVREHAVVVTGDDDFVRAKTRVKLKLLR